MRKILLTLHLAGGLISAVFLALLGASGGLLVFESEIDHALNAKLACVTPGGERMPLNALAEKLEQAHPGAKVINFMLPARDDLAMNVTLRTGGKTAGFAVNPYTGGELGAFDTANLFTKKLHQFHTNLLLGAPGKIVTMISAVFLLGLSLTGIVLWWPRKQWRLSPGASGKKLNFDLHNVLGFWASGFMFLFALTGIVIHWDDGARALVNKLAGATEPPPMPKPALPPRDAKPLGADELFSIAANAVPGAKVNALMGLGSPGAPVRVAMRFPEDRTPLGRTTLYLDGFSGKILSALDSRTGPIGFRVVKLWNRQIHTGDIAGWPTRIIACIASFSLPLLAITGPLIWWGRIRRKRNAE